MAMSKESAQVVATSQLAEGTAIPAIEMIDLCKSFGKFQAVDHLTLTVQQGEIFGLLGPNGSGKTTTINMVSGLSVPTSGEVRVMGYDVHRHARQVRQILGAVPQETALYEELTAWTNMDFHADLFGIPGKEKAEIQALPGVKEVVQDRTHLKITTQGISNVVPQIINIVSQEDELRNIAVREPNLDEIFLRLTGTALRD